PAHPRRRRRDDSRRRAHAALRAAGGLRLGRLSLPRSDAPMSEGHGEGWIGRPLKRREDHRLLTGAGAYVDDMTPPGCLHVALLRSPHAHARITRLDVEAARRAPGVRLVATGKDVASLGPMPVDRLKAGMRRATH